MTSGRLGQQYELDWDTIIAECDYNNDGVIDFEEFMTACIDKKVLRSQDDVKNAFRVLDANGDGEISFEEFASYVSKISGRVPKFHSSSPKFQPHYLN